MQSSAPEAGAAQEQHHASVARSESPSKLLIHCVPEPDESSKRGLASLVIRAIRWEQGIGRSNANRSVEIRNLEGQSLLEVHGVGQSICISLPAGTFHVSSSIESRCQTYTVTLEAGGSLNLYLKAR